MHSVGIEPTSLVYLKIWRTSLLPLHHECGGFEGIFILIFCSGGKYPNVRRQTLIGSRGIEPPTNGCKPIILPLDYEPN